MAFYNQYPNRKDHREPYRGSKACDRACRCHGSCRYCQRSRLHGSQRRAVAATERIARYLKGED